MERFAAGDGILLSTTRTSSRRTYTRMKVTSPSWLARPKLPTSCGTSHGRHQESRTAPMRRSILIPTCPPHYRSRCRLYRSEPGAMVGLQTDSRSSAPSSPTAVSRWSRELLRSVRSSTDPMVEKIFPSTARLTTRACSTVYTKDILNCRKSGVITGWRCLRPCRIIVTTVVLPWYGIDFLMADKLPSSSP